MLLFPSEELSTFPTQVQQHRVSDRAGASIDSFVAGRYYHPRREERILLFIDMRASTAIAERLGEERFLDFLNRFITDLSLAIAEAGGEIHKYVGDEIIATWTLAAGLNDAACVRACFAAVDRLAERGPAYERDFGCRADSRAGLHCGSVVVGELGYLKKEIALIGDSMNTAARIQEACRDTGCRVLASAALIGPSAGSRDPRAFGLTLLASERGKDPRWPRGQAKDGREGRQGRQTGRPAIHYSCAPHAGRTGFSFERKHWCRWQTARRARVTQPPHRHWPIWGSSQ
jgi:class 3 adenylate cyclase